MTKYNLYGILTIIFIMIVIYFIFETNYIQKLSITYDAQIEEFIIGNIWACIIILVVSLSVIAYKTLDSSLFDSTPTFLTKQ